MGPLDGAGWRSHIPSMQATCFYIMSHILSYRKLPWKQQSLGPKLLIFWYSIAKGITKWFFELPTLAFRGW